MSNLAQRIITAFIGAAIMISCMLWQAYTFVGIFFIISVFTHYEYVSIFKKVNTSANNLLINIIAGIFIYILVAAYALGYTSQNQLIYIIPVLSLFFILQLYTGTSNAFQMIGLNILGLIYIIMPFCFVNLIAIKGADAFDPHLILAVVLIIWSNDSFAYFSGRAFGKHKLFERISPKKTWEGFVGGVVASILCAVVFSYFYTDLSLAQWIGLGAIIAVFGTLGDLVESMLKRSMDIKDSSTSLPGHGGFLDRFDAFIMATPFVFTYLHLLGK